MAPGVLIVQGGAPGWRHCGARCPGLSPRSFRTQQGDSVLPARYSAGKMGMGACVGWGRPCRCCCGGPGGRRPHGGSLCPPSAETLPSATPDARPGPFQPRWYGLGAGGRVPAQGSPCYWHSPGRSPGPGMQGWGLGRWGCPLPMFLLCLVLITALWPPLAPLCPSPFPPTPPLPERISYPCPRHLWSRS